MGAVETELLAGLTTMSTALIGLAGSVVVIGIGIWTIPQAVKWAKNLIGTFMSGK